MKYNLGDVALPLRLARVNKGVAVEAVRYFMLEHDERHGAGHCLAYKDT